MCCSSFTDIPRYFRILTIFYVISALVPMRGVTIPFQVIISRIKKEKSDLYKNGACWARSVLCHTGWRQRDRSTVVTYVTKASSLAKTLIKPLTIIPTKPDQKAIHRVCTKESGGIQVPSRPPLSVMKDVCCTWRLSEKCLFAMINWKDIWAA